jgi:hypothetical protein
VKDNYNAELVELMKDAFELDVLSDLSQGTTTSNSSIDMVDKCGQFILHELRSVLWLSHTYLEQNIRP